MTKYIILKNDKKQNTFQNYATDGSWVDDLFPAVKFLSKSSAEIKLKELQANFSRGGTILLGIATLNEEETEIVESTYYSPTVNQNSYFNSAPYSC